MQLRVLIGKRIKYLRENRRLTQEQLAELSGLQPGTITSIETGVRFMSEETLAAIVKALDISYSELFSFNEREHNNSHIDAVIYEFSSLTDIECEYFLKIIRLYKQMQAKN